MSFLRKYSNIIKQQFNIMNQNIFLPLTLFSLSPSQPLPLSLNLSHNVLEQFYTTANNLLNNNGNFLQHVILYQRQRKNIINYK